MKITLETKRLILRETSFDDFDLLYEILSDKETMKYYPKPYDKDGTTRWINWCLDSYQKYGFGLWAVIIKETNTYIGDCGLSMQNIDGNIVPEIGYHINKKYHHQGYGSEASKAVKDYVFNNFNFNELFSYMNYDNYKSYFTAVKNDMSLRKVYDGVEKERVYSIRRSTWEEFNKANSGEFIYRKALLKDIPNIMSLVTMMRDEFPGLDSQEGLDEYKESATRMIHQGSCVVCYKADDLAGVICYSLKRNMINFLMVNPLYQRKGIEKTLMNIVLSDLEGNV